MRLNILFGGKAGQGTNEIALLVGEILAEKGYYVFNYRDYGSLIRGGHNFNILCISENPVQSFDWKVDILLALSDKIIELHEKDLKKGGRIIALKEDFGKSTNMAYAASLLCYLGIDKQELIKKIKEKFDEKWWKEDIAAAEAGYCLKDRIKLEKPDGKKKILITGGEAVAKSAKNSGLNFYFAYPMTPATNVMNFLAGMSDSNMKFWQSGNEIEAVNAAIGASFAGKISMTGSSGGGFDLMTEALSFQGMSEIPLTVYLSSRPGPGTGVPTYSMQSDIKLALYAGHGEFPRVVVMPGDVEESVILTNQAMQLAEKFGCLSIIMSDKHLAESEFTIEKLPEIKQINITRKIPGKQIVKASSYEHLENGDTTEEAGDTLIGMNKRLGKEKEIEKEVSKLETYKVYGFGSKLFITSGSTKGAVLDYINQHGGKMLHLLYLSPFPNIETEMKKVKEVYVVECNSTGQLAELITAKTCMKVKKILKYDGRPFTPDEIKEGVK